MHVQQIPQVAAVRMGPAMTSVRNVVPRWLRFTKEASSGRCRGDRSRCDGSGSRGKRLIEGCSDRRDQSSSVGVVAAAHEEDGQWKWIRTWSLPLSIGSGIGSRRKHPVEDSVGGGRIGRSRESGIGSRRKHPVEAVVQGPSHDAVPTWHRLTRKMNSRGTGPSSAEREVRAWHRLTRKAGSGRVPLFCWKESSGTVRLFGGILVGQKTGQPGGVAPAGGRL